jgi:hypothetical protein
MTTTTNTSARGDSVSTLEAPATPRAHSRFGARRGWVIWAAVLAATAAVVALVVVTLTGSGDDTTPATGAHTGSSRMSGSAPTRAQSKTPSTLRTGVSILGSPSTPNDLSGKSTSTAKPRPTAATQA